MIRRTSLQLIAMLVVGALGGYLAASGRLPLLQRSDAAPPTQNSVTRTTPCCDGADRGVLLARVDVQAIASK